MDDKCMDLLKEAAGSLNKLRQVYPFYLKEMGVHIDDEDWILIAMERLDRINEFLSDKGLNADGRCAGCGKKAMWAWSRGDGVYECDECFVADPEY